MYLKFLLGVLVVMAVIWVAEGAISMYRDYRKARGPREGPP